MARDYILRRRDRELGEFIEQETLHKDVLLVEGARQVGKTSLVERALAATHRRATSLNLERDAVMRAAIDRCAEFKAFAELLEDRCGFTGDTDQLLFIDEAQESLKLGGFVRFMKEEWPRATVILSGSTLRRLFRRDVRYPVGRVRSLALGPFSFSEFLAAMGETRLGELLFTDDPGIGEPRHQRLLELFDSFLETGGLPEVVLARARGEDFRAVRESIIAGYEQDFIRLFGEEAIHLVNACFRSVANFAGGVSKNTSVVANPGSTINALINDTFARLESWRLILRSDQRGPSPEAGQHFLPKRYLFDTGVLRHLREASVPSISILHTLDTASRTPLGGVLENQAAIELARTRDRLTGWKRTPSGGEIDFVVKTGGSAVPVECKASLTINRRHMKGLFAYLAAMDQPTGVIISFAPRSVTKSGTGRRVVNIPAYLMERLEDATLL
jgi:predicted AAA+ superfamily ATPase